MRAVDLIAKKRDGGIHHEDEIQFLINGFVAGEIPDYQMAAWLMAVYFQSLNPTETGILTKAMIQSGDVIDLSGLSGPLVDKHSTGGVGDKLSLILAPMVAACGVQVPMMSGRALGHTGGTLDKLDAIPGYRTALTPHEFRDTIAACGFAMTGQSREIVPADRLMYALRDVTSTVESIPLITASIMSKKFAEGAEALVFDVKCGSGAFMKTPDSARALAHSLVETGRSLGRQTVALLTSMDEPLGKMVGNFLEVEESWESLNGRGPADVMEVTARLAAWMLIAGGLEKDIKTALKKVSATIDDGSAAQLFLKNIQLQGGDPEKFISLCGKRESSFHREIVASADGFLGPIEAMAVGRASVRLGVGRDKTTDLVSPHAGIEFMCRHGDFINKGDLLAVLHADDTTRLDDAEVLLSSALRITESRTQRTNLILEEITPL